MAEVKRESGYYHVRFKNGHWGVAYYSSGYWMLYGNTRKYHDDNHFAKIAEKVERAILY